MTDESASSESAEQGKETGRTPVSANPPSSRRASVVNVLAVRLLAALALAWSAGAAAAGDLIVMADGRVMGASKVADPPRPADFAASQITVTEENVDGIVYRLAGVATKQTLPRAQVRRVLHDPATTPGSLPAGLAALEEGRFDAARERLYEVARSPSAPAWAQAEAAFRRAESYAIEGNAGAAERALAAFAQERSRSRQVLEARPLRARILLELGRDEEARSEYDALARTDGLSAEEAASARFFAAWAGARNAIRTRDATHLAAASRTFAEVASKSAGAKSIADRCAVARAACGGDAEGIASIVAASEDPFVLAVGNVLLADALRERGAAEKDRAALEEAQERYLKTTLLYRDAEGVLDFAASAQFRAGELFLLLAPEDSAAAVAEAKVRARREWEDLLRRAPRTEAAKRAKTALAELR